MSHTRDSAQAEAGELLEQLDGLLAPGRITEIMMTASLDPETAQMDPTAVDPATGEQSVIVTERGSRIVSWHLFTEALRQELRKAQMKRLGEL